MTDDRMFYEALSESARRADEGEPCWCGHVNAAHVGWLVCAQQASHSTPGGQS